MNTTKAEPKFRIVWESDIPICIGVELNLQWSEIPWKQVEKRVYKLQKRIYQASSRGDVKTVRGLQRLLMKSWSAKTLAVRRVSQDNQGKNTAGVDGVKSLTPKQRINLVTNLKIGVKAKPTRRVWIPKPVREERRPLGIPTIEQRALQALVKLGLEPEWEARFEPNSYGFRPGRSCQDAIKAISQAITQKAKYVLDADISKCFDRIHHEQLLLKLNTFPTLRRQIRAWLKAGVMDGQELFPTDEGCPQGGVISPLLANIALHGMEERIKTLAETFSMKYHSRNKQISKRDKRSSVSLIRYADDFVIIHEDVNAVQKCKEVILEFLRDMGLELKPSKTRLVHTLQDFDGEKPGFDFLGFNIRQYKAGKHSSGRNGHKEILGYKTNWNKWVKIDDNQTNYIWNGRSEVVQRLLANECEICGATDNIEVHHIRKLADIKQKGRKERPEWMVKMSARKRKTLVVCRQCHEKIQYGRYDGDALKT
jgi:RNA-directed DNA polymerase